MDRTQLFDSLSNLPTAAFDRLLVAVNMPRMNRAGAAAKIGDQVIALLEWADSNIGPGLEAIAHHLAELNHFEFDAYLRSLVTTYEKWWEHYTLTDAIGKVEPPAKPSAFDFGLMVQTITKEREPTDPENTPLQQDKEKTERLPVLEGIRKYADDHVLLVGRPGSGKSTALIRLLLEEATLSPGPSPKIGRGGQERIPVLVELRYWQTSVLERIRAFLYQHDPHLNLDDAALNALLRQRQFLLLIDGLNELPSDEARTQLTTFRRDHPKVPMIFTTRDLGLGGDLGIEKKLEMQPLTEPQMKEFIRAYVPDQAEAMLRQLSDRLREFGQTPLLLWMLCEVFQQSPNLQMPTNLAEVFRAFTTMYEDSSVRKHEVALLKGDVRPLSDRRLWKEALKALAALMMQGETPVDFRVAIHRTEAERELGKLFAKEKFPVRDILDDLLKYHLLQNRTTDQLEFRHQLIQEYYAAEHLLDLLPELSDEQLKRNYLNLLKWTEPIGLMLALVNDEAQALRVVKLAMDDVDLTLGASFLESVKQQYQRQAAKIIENLAIDEATQIGILKLTKSKAIANHFIETLKLSGSNASRKIALTLHELDFLQSGDIKGIYFPEEKPKNHFFSTITTELDFETINWLEYNLVIPSLSDVIFELQQYLQGELCFEWEVGDGSSEENLLSTLNRVNIIQACLSDSSDNSELIPGILEILGNSIPQIRSGAVRVLGMLEDVKPLQNIMSALDDVDPEVRKAAAEALINFDGNNETIEGLLESLEKEDDDSVRFEIFYTLGELAKPKYIRDILLSSQLKARDYHCLSTVATMQNRCKFYNYEIWQEAEEVQNEKLEIQKTNQGDSSGQTINQFPNAIEVKIFERVEHYHEYPLDSSL